MKTQKPCISYEITFKKRKVEKREKKYKEKQKHEYLLRNLLLLSANTRVSSNSFGVPNWRKRISVGV
jgi:hypothetical protein